jgi:hypothetical protein
MPPHLPESGRGHVGVFGFDPRHGELVESRSWHAPQAANDRAPREKRSTLTRFADAIGSAMLWLGTLSFAGILAALLLGHPEAAWPFIGSMASAALTLVLTGLFERRLEP